ncbi:hypothetical protein HYG86_05245 [Alkalicella caledoniensis]|uniref:Uncharacterized protein n=1 Tax=Alkalicella caledoniensis TaxID=2731377 RepID=A0A7G9W6A6_ALKCA|nr:hypothetical protein [Alkalicella caledoniensis]QNO14218.1 hypothetical protein HYG86_05245 [Alkalicella caledoniensis]
MELINRYIYAVIKDLPEKQREDISKELKTLIDDMLEGEGEEKNDAVAVKKVLKELDDPAILASKYRGSERYLIGPGNYDSYIMILKIVTVAIFIGVSISKILGGIFSPEGNLLSVTIDYLVSLFVGVLQGFAWVTIGFAIAEQKGSKIEDTIEKENQWSLDDLPEVPQKEARISRVESGFSIVFTTIFFSLLYFNPQLFAIYSRGAEGTVVTPVLNIDALSGFKGMIIGIFLLNVLKETIKLIKGRWNLRLAVVTSILSAMSMIITLYVFNRPSIWNPELNAQIAKHLDIGIEQSTAVLGIVIIASAIEIVTSLYKGYKYNSTKL